MTEAMSIWSGAIAAIDRLVWKIMFYRRYRTGRKTFELFMRERNSK